MSFQAYLDAAELKTGLTPRELVARAQALGFNSSTKAGQIIEWLAKDYGLGRGHAMSIVHVLQKGPQIREKVKDSDGVVTETPIDLWLDGKATKP